MDQIIDSLEFSALLISVFAGIITGIPTGPARFFVLDTCLNDGKRAAAKVYGGLFTAVMLYACLALSANNYISGNERIESVFYLAASLLLILWGIIIILKSNKKNKASIRLNFGSWFKKGFIVGISNPVTPFIYLTFVQLIRIYAKSVTTVTNVLFILIFELFSFLTISIIVLIVLHRKEIILNHWYKVKIVMGIFLISLGSYNTWQQVDFRNGIELNKNDTFIEEQVNKKENQ